MSRSIRLTRSSRKESYGFEFKTLKLDGKHVAFNVIPGSIAAKNGLMNGDYILEINDESISGLWHDAVLMKMSTYARKLDLLVVNDLSSFIKSHRSSFRVTNSNNNYKDDTRSIVSSQTDASFHRANFRTNEKIIDNMLTARINNNNNNNDRMSETTSRSFKQPVTKANGFSNHNRTHSSDDLTKTSSTPKTTAKNNRFQVIKPLIKFIGSTRVNQANHLNEIKSKLNEYAKLVRLKRNELSNELNYYGFNFRTSKEGQHIVNNVIPDYPAYEAGLRDGDYILEVNGELITGLYHNQVIKKILFNLDHVDLLIVNDLDGYLNARQLYSQIKDERISDLETNRYYVKKTANTELGLNLVSNGIITNVEPFSPAEKAGLRKGLKIIKINDINIAEKTNIQIRKLIKDNENFLVIDAFKLFDSNLPHTNGIDNYEISNDIEILKNTNTSIHTIKKQFPQSDASMDDTIDSLDSSITTSNTNNKINNIHNTATTNNNNKNYTTNNGESIYNGEISQIRVHTNHQQNQRINNNQRQITNSEIYSNEPIFVPKEPPSVPSAPIYSDSKTSNKTYYEIDNLTGSRSINLIPRPDYQGFGFELIYNNKTEGPAEISNVKKDSPAFAAGLRDRDLVLKINDESVVQEEYKKIVDLIRELSLKGPIKFEVIDKSIYRSINRDSNEITADFTPINKQLRLLKNDNRFKRCFLTLLSDYEGFGFTITPSSDPKLSIIEVDENSPAYKANLRKDDVIIECDKVNIRRFKFDEVLKLMRNGTVNQQIEILAISLKGYYYYKDRNKKFSSKKLVTIENTDLYSC